MKKSIKRVLSGAVAGVMLSALSVAVPFGAAADIAGIKAGYIGKRVVVSGHIDQDSGFKDNKLAILLTDKADNAIAYINEALIDDYGNYRHSFEFFGDKDIGDYSLKVKAGEADAVDTVTSLGCFTDMIEAEVADRGENSVEICVKLTNDYCINQDYVMYAAAYTADGTLSDVKAFDGSAKMNDGKMQKFIKLSKNGKEVSEVKLFSWDGTDGITPLGKVFAFGGKNEEGIKDAVPKIVYNRIEAETFEKAKSANVELNPDSFGIQNTDYRRKATYMCFKDVDLTGVKSVTALADTNRDNEYLELRLDSPNGDLIGKLPLVNSGEYAHGMNVCCSLTYAGIKETAGTHDLYVLRPDGSTANFMMEHFVLSSGVLAENAEDEKPYYAKETDIMLSEDKKTAEYSFSGTGVDYITNLSPSAGEVKVFVDGKEETVLNLSNSETVSDRTVYTKTGLSKWNHTIRIESEDAIENIGFKVYKRPIIVACVGDSITDGVGNIGGKYIFSWPAQLQKRLGSGYYVVDCGHNGSTTEGIFGFSQGKTALKLNADIFINALYTNDKEPNYKDNPTKFKNNYKNTMDRLSASSPGARIYVAVPPCGNTRNVDWWQQKRTWTEEVAAENNWPIIDFDYVLNNHRNEGLDSDGNIKQGFYFIDGTHPSAKGYSFITAAVKMSLPCPELLDKAALDSEIERLDKFDTTDKNSHTELKGELDSLDENGNIPSR